MCDRYSYLYGYICNECFNELLECENIISIEDFMNSYKKDDYKDTVNEWKEYCNNEFDYL
jgi:hypothetical protein